MIVIDRNVFEWRFDFVCEYYIFEIIGYDVRVIIVCNEGYSFSLVVVIFCDIGFYWVIDFIGGY